MTDKRPAYDYRYSIIPGGAVTDGRLSLRDIQILALLGRHTKRNGWCFRSQVEMAKEISCGRATVSRSIKRLIDAGWVEAKALPRGRTVLKEGQQPFSAFSYRVIIDRADEEDIIEAADVPKNGHPTDPSKNGQEVPTAIEQGVPTQAGTHRRINLNDQLNSLAPDGADESDKIASLREAEPGRFQEFRSAWAQEMPDGFPAKDEATARAEFGRQTRLTEADTLIAAARLHGAAETARHKGRRGGDFRTKLPSNWLKDGGWEGYVRQITENADREKNTTLALVRVQEALGHGLFEILRHQLKLPDYTIAALDGATYEPGPPPVLAGTGVQRIILERHTFALQRALGEDLEIVVSGAGRRSA